MKKSIYFLIGVMLLSSQLVFAQPGVDEEYDCETTVLNRSGTLDSSRCKNQEGRIACYEDVRQTCLEKNTRKKLLMNFRQFTGSCVSSYSGCW
ncbi:MAG: hypothetical protein HYY62_00660 [Deltaproteobacteria bacterium]|nr:hypothetical protein [Deltaproteobacteria bacterium]